MRDRIKPVEVRQTYIDTTAKIRLSIKNINIWTLHSRLSVHWTAL